MFYAPASSLKTRQTQYIQSSQKSVVHTTGDKETFLKQIVCINAQTSQGRIGLRKVAWYSKQGEA
jgi:hypothetical protein